MQKQRNQCHHHDNDNVGIDNNSTRSKRYAIRNGHSTFYKWGQTNVTYNISKYSKKLNHQKVDKVIAKAINVWSKSQALYGPKTNKSVNQGWLNMIFLTIFLEITFKNRNWINELINKKLLSCILHRHKNDQIL